MAEKSEGTGLVWLVVVAMVAAGVAAYMLVPGPDGGGGGGGGGAGNQPPVATFAPVNRSVDIGQSVEFSGVDSSDPDGQIKTFAWDFGDGQHASGAVAEHTYTIVGAFDVSLTVTDDGGKTDTLTGHVWVNDYATFAPGFANWTTGQPPSTKTVGTMDVWPGATAFHIVVNASTVQLAGAKLNISIKDPQDVEVKRESRTIAGNNFVTQVSILLQGANLSKQGTWTVVIEVGPAQPTQFFVSVAYTGWAAVRYDPA